MLSENNIGEEGAEKLADHVWKTKSLRYVNLSLNNIPQSGIMGLRKAAYSHGNLHIQVSTLLPPVGLIRSTKSALAPRLYQAVRCDAVVLSLNIEITQPNCALKV